MRLLMHTVLLVSWGICRQTIAGGDTFAAVAGTGWTDISKLESTCSQPGYFVNPSDCSRFYVCVDHSTPEHRLLLRYDFDCPGGLAFDESTKNCNYPGPSGCVTSSSGWGWNNGQGNSGWNSGQGNSGWNSGQGNSGWNSGQGNSGWNSGKGNSGIFESAKVVPSWGSQTQFPVSGHGATIVHLPSSAGTIVRGASPTPRPFPSNPRITLPATSVVQAVPVTNWESFRLRPTQATRIFQSTRVVPEVPSNESGWSPPAPANPVVFQSSKLTVQQGGSSSGVTWGASKVFPVDTTVFQAARVTPAPPASWEIPKAFPQPAKPIVEGTNSGWSQQVRVTPTPAQPVITPSLEWESARVTPVPHAPVSWQKITQSHQQAYPYNPQQSTDSGWNAPQAAHFVQARPAVPSNPSHNFIHTSSPQFPPSSFDFVQSGPPPGTHQHVLVQPSPPPPQEAVNIVHAHPQQTGHQSVHIVQSDSSQDGHDHHDDHDNHQSLHFVQPINPPAGNSISLGQVHEHAAPANPTVTVPAGWENVRITQLPSGYIWQSSPNAQTSRSENYVVSTQITPTVSPSPSSLPNHNFGIVHQVINEGQGEEEVNRKSHIQQIYENKERQVLQQQIQNDAAQGQAAQELSPQDPGNPVYQFISPPGSGIKGRIIVLYAPLNRGGKRDVPVIEVEVEDGDDNDNNGDNDSQNT